MIFINDMAKDNSGFPVLNSDVKHWEGACVGPTNLKNCEPNLHAFSQEDESLLDLVPPSVMSQLKDKSNWSNRLLAANEIERILKQPSTAITNDKLKFVVELIMTSIGDSQFKVSQKGLQVMVQLVSIVGKRILSFLPVLTPKVLAKMGSTKGDLKKRGMALFHVLIEVVGPAKVVTEVCSCGMTHKTSRVREESINVIILSLLHDQNNNGLHFPSVAKDLALCMADTKPKVRQAAFEAMALLTSKLDESEFEQVVALVADVHSRFSPQQPSNINLMDAYYARLERHSLPTLNEQGLMQYSVAPVNTDGSVSSSSCVGADVDWIVTPLVMSSQGQGEMSGALRGSRVMHPLSPPSFRPNLSAGKRPWEMEEHFEVTSTSTPAPPTFSMEPAARPSILSPHFAPRTSSISAASTTMKLPGNSYMDLHLSKQAKMNVAHPVVPGHMPLAVNPSAPHTLESIKKPRSGTNFFVHVASMNGRDPQCSVPHQDPSPSVGEGSLISPDDTPSSMSMTWPRATLCLSGTPSRVPSVLSARAGTGLSSVAPLPLKAPTQINTDTVSLVESQNSVKTSFSRPHSKPRVRNPLSSIKHSTQPVPLGHAGGGGLSAFSPNQENAAAQLEQDFLRGTSTPHPWTDPSYDEEYFTIPEDNTILNSSLSASLSSLNEPEADKLKHIRKEAATRKAQILSTNGAAKSGPEAQQSSNHHHSHQQPSHSFTPRLSEAQASPYSKVMTPLNSELSLQQSKKCPPLVHLDTKPPILLPKKWNSQDHGKEDKTYSQVFLKKLANTPAKLKPAGLKLSSQTVPQPVTFSEEGTAVHSISLEGRGLDQSGSGDKPRDPLHHKKKHKKDQSVPNKGRTAISTSLFQEGNGERRPTIERGGTNTISMEVSGIGSRNSTEQTQRTPQPAVAKNNETTSPKRTAPDYEMLSSKKKSHSAVYPNNSHETPLVVQEADESSGGIPAISSAPIETTHKRNKKRKQPSQGSTPQKTLGGDKPTLGSKHTHVWNDSDSQTSGMGGALMEMDLGLLEGHVHAHPDHAVKAALQSLAKEDWNNKCEGIGMVVILARDFPHILLNQLHAVLIALQKEVKNLRSSVSKKATECLSYLFSTMKRSMEADLDQVVQVLLHKSSESNTFLRESVEKALTEMVSNVTLSKAVLSLIAGGMANRNSQVRKLTAKYVCMAIELHEPSKYLHLSKDVLDKSLPAIIQFTKDSSPDCRYYGRKSLNMLWPEPEFNHVASKVFKNDLYTEAKDIVDTLKMKGVGDPPAEFKSHPSSTNSSRHPTGGSTRVANTVLRDGLQETRHGGSSPNTTSSSPNADTPKKIRKQPAQQAHGRDSGLTVPSPPTLALPDGVLERLQSSSWNDRYEAISQLEDYVITARPQTLSAHLQRVFDAFTSKLTDRNSKVTLHALQAFANMVPIVHSALIPIIANILSTLVNNLASRNVTLHSTAMTVFNLLSDHIDASILIPSVANSSQYGNARVQPIMTRRLANLTKVAYRQKPQLVCRHVLPVVWHHVTAKAPVKGEARLALHELCCVLQECMQQGFLESAAHLSMEDNTKLKELLDWDGNGR